MASRIDGARHLIRWTLGQRKRPLVSFSGGLDSIVLASIAVEEGVCDGYANLSFHFPSQEAEIRQIAADIGLRLVGGRPNETPEWIGENAEHLFPPPKQFITGNFNLGNAFSCAGPVKYAQDNGFDAVFCGNTAAQNGAIHQAWDFFSVLSVSPLIKFKRDEVLRFLRERSIAIPKSYSSPLIQYAVQQYGKEWGRRTGSYAETYFDGTTAAMLDLLHRTARFWGDDKDGAFAPEWFLLRFPFLRERE